MTDEITVPEGWIEKEPERFESRLFVSEETFQDSLVTKAHVAYYADEGTIEVGEQGEYSFYDEAEKSLQEVLCEVGYDE